MKKLNGWWRLWIALSVIWAVIIGFVFFTDSNRYGASERLRDAVAMNCVSVLDGGEINWSSVPPEMIEAAMAAVASPANKTALQTLNSWKPAAASDPYTFDLLLVAKTAQGNEPNDAKKFITSCLNAKRHDYEQDVIRQRHFDMILALGIMVVPPLLLLILGYLVSWVIAGFRNPRPLT